MAKLFPKQKAVLDAITSLYSQLGRFPNKSEIAREVPTSVSSVHGHMLALAKKGYMIKNGPVFTLVKQKVCPFCDLPFTSINLKKEPVQKARFVLLKPAEPPLGPIELIVDKPDWASPSHLVNLLLRDGWQVIKPPELL